MRQETSNNETQVGLLRLAFTFMVFKCHTLHKLTVIFILRRNIYLHAVCIIFSSQYYVITCRLNPVR